MPRSTREADAILRQAWAVQFPTLRLSDQARQAALSVSRFEGGYGQGKYANGNHVAENWGALRCPDPVRDPRSGELWTHCVTGIDTDGAVPFRGYDDAVSGARDFLRVWVRAAGRTRDSGNIDAVARAMRDARYYTAPLEKYVAALERNAAAVAKELGEPQKFRRGNGLGALAWVGLVALGVGWYLLGGEGEA